MLEEIFDNPAMSAELSRRKTALAPPARARRAQLAVATLFLVNGAAIGSWVPHIPERARVLGLNTAQLGTTLLAIGIGAVCAMPLAGTVLRLVGSKAAAITAGFCFPALVTLAIFLSSLRLLAADLFFVGLFAAIMDVAMNAHGVLVEALLRRRTVSLFHAVFSVGCFAGAGIQSVFMARQVPDRFLVTIFGGILLLLVLAAAPMLFSKHLERNQQERERSSYVALQGSVRASLRARLPHPRLLLLGVLCFSAMVTEGAMGDWSALYLRVVHGIASGTAGYGYTCFAGMMVLGRFSGDSVVARLGELRAIRFGGLVSAAGILMILLLHPLAGVLLGFTLMGAGIANASPILYRTAGTLPGFAPGEGLATAVGVGYAGLLIGPPLLGLLAHKLGLPSIFVVLLALSLTLTLAAPLVRTCRMPSARA